MKRGDVRVKTRGDLTTLAWKDRQEVYMLTNMDPPPAEGNFCDDSNQTVKPHTVEWYNRHMGYVDNSDHMASYSMSQWTFKWTTKLFFHLLDQTVVRSWILLSSCGAKYTYWDFRLLLVRNLSKEAGKSQHWPTPRLVGRPSGAATNVVQPESCHASKIIHQTVLLFVFISQPEKGHTVWVHQIWCRLVCGALFHGISHQSEFVNHPLCEYCVSW